MKIIVLSKLSNFLYFQLCLGIFLPILQRQRFDRFLREKEC
jgi:hypothetical protein